MKISRKIDPFSPISFFLLSSLLNFFGTYIYLINYFNSGSLDSTPINRLGLKLDDYNLGFLFFCLYFTCWIVGYEFASRKTKNRTLTFSVEKGKPLDITLFYIVYFCLLIVFFLLFYYHPYRLSNASRSLLTNGIYGKLFFVVVSLLISFYVTFSVHILEKLPSIFSRKLVRFKKIINEPYKSNRVKYYLGLTFLALNTLIIVFFLLILQGKARAIFPLVILLILYHYIVRPVPLIFIAGFSLFIVATVFFVEIYLFGGRANLERISDSMFGLSYGRMFDSLYNLSMLVNHALTSSNFNFFYGETFLSDILSDVGIKFGVGSREYLMSVVYGYPEDITFGLPISIPGEFYLNFGILGIICGGFILGYISRYVYFFLVEGAIFGKMSIPCYIVFLQIIATPSGELFQKLVLNMLSISTFVLFSLFFLGSYKRVTIKLPRKT